MTFTVNKGDVSPVLFLKRRFAAAAFLSLALAACGGGSSGGGYNPPAPSPTTPAPATPTPSPTPMPTPQQNISYTLAGSVTQNDTYTYPAPSPLPPTTSTSNVTLAVSPGSSPFPNGAGPTSDVHEVLSNAGPLSTNVTTTDSWYGPASGSTKGIALYGFASADNANDSMSVMYTTPLVTDLNPETNGGTWSNSIAGITNATYADGETLARTDNADGSSTETTTDTLSHHYTFVLQDNADGTGSYTGSAIAALQLQSLNVSAPANGKITVTYLSTPSDTFPSPTPVVIATPAAWFAPGSPLYKESNTETTLLPYPANCAVPAQFGTTGTKIEQTINRIDPMIGTNEQIVNDTYLSPSGPVCMTMTDTLTENYDYLDDTADSYANFADFSGTAVHTQTIAQTLTMQSAAGAASASAHAATMSTKGGLSPAIVTASRAQFALSVARTRHNLMAKIVKRIEAKIATEGRNQ